MPTPRRLAAIMFTDMVGFTRLGQQDEDAALRLRRECQALLRPLFLSFGGREVKSLGDGFLVEFPSAVESVRCAVEIQRSVAQRNGTAGATTPLLIRIGIHLGDILEEDGDVVGDAVNVASRIEPLAEPGGICLSGTVFDQVRNKLPIAIEKLGARSLKNVREPVDLYRVVDGALPSRPVPAPSPAGGRLAVLPLANLSSDAADGFFADGLTDELIFRTSQVPHLRVIARTSVQRYKGSPKSIREVGAELDVGVALEGSVRKAGSQVRIAVQLVDVRSEAPIWAMRYDRPLDDLFAIQDDIAGHIAAAVAERLAGPPPDPVPRPSGVVETTDMEAYSLFLHGRQLLGEKGSVEGIRTAVSLFETAVARDPSFARARVALAETLLWLATEGVANYAEAEARASQELRTALAQNERIAEAHSTLAALYLSSDRFADTEREARRAIELNPSLADPYRWLAQLAAGGGNIDESIRLLESARQLNPEDVNVLSFLGRALFYAGRDADALAFWAATKDRIRFRTNAHLCEYSLSKGDLDQAGRSLREMEEVRPNSPWTLMYQGVLGCRRGRPEIARENIDRLCVRLAQGEMTVFFIGFLELALGDTDRFVARMEEALQRGSLPLLELLYSPLYATARQDPRVQDILRQQRTKGPLDPSPGAR